MFRQRVGALNIFAIRYVGYVFHIIHRVVLVRVCISFNLQGCPIKVRKLVLIRVSYLLKKANQGIGVTKRLYNCQGNPYYKFIHLFFIMTHYLTRTHLQRDIK